MRIILLIALIGLSACTQPGVTLRAPETQQKVDTASDWRNIAFITAEKLVAALHEVEEIDPATHEWSAKNQMPLPPLGAREYYIHSQNTGAPFTKTFTPFLSESIRKMGRSVKLNPQNAVIVNYHAQTFYYGGDGYARRPIDHTTLFTTAAALGIKAADHSWSTNSAAMGVAALGPILDILISMGEITNAEVVLTVSVISGDRILYQNSEVIYVNPADLPFYWSENPAARPLQTDYFGQEVRKSRTIQLRRD